MKHLNKFNESKKEWTKSCPECGEKVEMYYIPYCPVCDIQEIIKHKRGSYCLIPILDWGMKYLDEDLDFDKDVIWDYLCNYEYMKGNDTYFGYNVNDTSTYKGRDVGKMIKKVLDDLNIDYAKDDNEVLFWVSW